MGEACIQGFSPRDMQPEPIIVPTSIFIRGPAAKLQFMMA
jgi:hypothetical protein